MKHFKNIRQYMAICLMIVFASSCSKWLDGALPKDKNLEEQQFATEMGINSVLNGIYRAMASGSMYGAQLTKTDIELLAHYYYYDTNLATNPGYTRFVYLSEYYTNETRSYFTGVWSSSYAAIFRVNNFIKNLEYSSALMSEDRKKVLLGEAYGLRAFLHFDLFRIFGDKEHGIPYNDSPEVLPHKFKTTEEVFDLILKDIAKAASYLEKDPILTDGVMDFYKQNDAALNYVPVAERFAYYLRNYRMNFFAVQALKARVLMNKGDVKEAAKIAQDILTATETLFTWGKVADINKKDDANYILYSEAIFGIYNPDLHTTWRAYTEGTVLGSTYAVHIENLQQNIFKYDATNSDISVWSDIRARQWTPSKIGDGQYVSRKFDDNYNSAENNPKRFFQPLMRIAELKYIIAESLILEGRIPEAIGIINEVLTMRGVSDEALRPTTVTESEAFDILETEYYKEFYGEGQVYFYLKRRGNEKIFKVDAGGKTNIPGEAYLILVPTSENIND